MNKSSSTTDITTTSKETKEQMEKYREIGKYYLAKMDDFCIGLKYEVNDWSDGDIWNLCVLDEFTVIPSERVKQGLVRIKVLDDEDIISIGWRRDNVLDEDDKIVAGYTIGGESWYDLFFKDGKAIIIHKMYRNQVGQVWNKLFEGVIMNKVQLQRLMQQIGIKANN